MKLYGVIGCPITHSLSPLMHNDAFKNLGIDAYYHAFHVEKENLSDAVRGLKALGVAGFNVTIPHKTTILPLLDGLDVSASVCGAVNTVVCENGKYIGYNTDGLGFIHSLHQLPKQVLIIGAGGAARGIAVAFLEKNIHADITNRTIEKAEKLLTDLQSNGKTVLLSTAMKQLAKYDMIVQTTSVGLNEDKSPLSLENIHKEAIAIDIVYKPLITTFLKEAKQYGATTQDGLGMFVFQGALAFEKWTGLTPSIERMREVVLQKLGGKECLTVNKNEV